MRLTLRTMLAYLDDVLEPADSQEIGKKIEESEFAANIVHKTRDVMRRLRLGAPKLSGRGMGLDTNTVAEYLDSTLPPDRVVDFEKVCLESDVHLAEVASCHQILAVVLEEPAEVDPESRQRMYLLPAQQEAAQAEARQVKHAAVSATTVPMAAGPADAVSSNGSAQVEVARPERKRLEVPDYLREPNSTSPWWRVAAVLAGVVLFLCVVVMAVGPDEVAQKLGWNRPADNAPPTLSQSASTPKEPLETARKESTGKPNLESSDQPASLQPPEDLAPKQPGKAAVEPMDPPAPAGELAKPAGAAADAKPAVAAPGNPATPAATSPASPAATNPATPLDVNAKPGEALDKSGKGKDPTLPPIAASTVGRFISNNQVLLRFNPATNSWQRVPQQQLLATGDQLVSLPTFRCVVLLASGVTIELLGGSIVEVLPAATDGISGLRLTHGRLVARTGRSDSSLRLHAGEQQGIVSFLDDNSTLALEVHPVRIEGTDPEAQSPQLTIDLFAAEGGLSWVDKSGTPQALAAPTQRRLGPPGVLAPAGNAMPDWVMNDPPIPDDIKLAREPLEKKLTPDRPIVLSLQELAEDQKRELRTLSVSCLSYLGEFEALVSALNRMDLKQRINWSDLLEDLRSAIARDPKTAIAVRRELERQRGDSGTRLYRMLWGYTEGDMRGDVGKMLVDALDNEHLDVRSVAFWNLRNLTGQTLGYQPNATAENRKKATATWRQRHTSGQLGDKNDR